MITLYYHRGACSTSNHFALEEAGVEYEAIEVDLKVLDDPLVIKVRALNPMAQTPVLVLADGQVLTQNAAILPFIADLAPEKELLPRQGTIERAHAESWLAFIASDLHPIIMEYAYASLPDNDADRAKSRRLYEDRVERDVLPWNHAVGNLARQMETSDAAKPIYRESDYWRAARA